MARCLVPAHREGFFAIFDANIPNWWHMKKHLNDLPLDVIDLSNISTLR